MVRPVLLLAPLSDSIINKLISESPDKYCSCPISKNLLKYFNNWALFLIIQNTFYLATASIQNSVLKDF